MVEDDFELEFFKENGFVRKKCAKCGTYFWTSDKNRQLCGETPCEEYQFVNKPLTPKKYTLEEMRETYLSFFEKKGHTRIERYPVIARWRNDVFLVNASIYDFQPHVTSGLVKSPANPLTISQPCIRLIDTDNVGKTAGHLTGFEMMAHHVFNYPDKQIYWKEKCVSLCNELLTQELGISEKLITYKEKPWCGGGNAGAALEVIAGGIELATLVFMDMVEDKNGPVEIDGHKYKKMDLQVVDTGYGLERFTWVSQGKQNIYESVYPKLIETLKKESKNDNLSDIYIIADHTRSLAFMLSDGIVPSNIKAGYLARMLIRRTIQKLDNLKSSLKISDIVEMQTNRFSDVIDTQMLFTVKDLLEIEEKRYRKTIEKGLSMVKRSLQKDKKVDLLKMYDTHGILPEMIKEIGKELNIDIQIPENFHEKVSLLHEKVEIEKEKEKPDIPYLKTELLYYEDAYIKEFDAKVLYSEDNKIILDKTAFYPEGGGQPCDLGIITADGKSHHIKDVQKYGNTIIHEIDGVVSKDTEIHGKIDWNRRNRLMKHHTATHILLGVAREMFGQHVWQSGAQKDVLESRVDISHYKRINENDKKELEKRVLEKIMECIDVEINWLDRKEADKEYGFRLYQGGAPKVNLIRVVKLKDLDVEGCGGTHVKNTGEIGTFKIIKTERIQDGVERIVFSAGLSALEHIQEMENQLNESSDILSVEPKMLPSTTKKFFEDTKILNKKLEKLQKTTFNHLLNNAEQIENIKLVASEIDGDMKDLTNIAKEVSNVQDTFLILWCLTDERIGLIVARSKNLDIDAGNIAKIIADKIDGSAGGKPDFAQGGGKDISKIQEAVDNAIIELRRIIKDVR